MNLLLNKRQLNSWTEILGRFKMLNDGGFF